MEEKVFFEGELGKVCGVLHSVDNKDEIVIVVHGFSSSKESSAKNNSEHLNSIGINALRIDLDNQGESELDFKTGVTIPNYVKQVDAAIKFVKKRRYKEISLLGTSFGGLVVLAAALEHPEIKRIFLRASVFDWHMHLRRKFGEDIEKYKETDKLVHINKDGKTIYYTFDSYTTAKDYSMYEQGHKLKMPIMILQGDADESVDYKDAIRAVDAFPNARLHIIKGATHKLDVDGDFSEGVEVMLDFFWE